MRFELLRYHCNELQTCENSLRSWEDAPDDDEKAKREHTERLIALVKFHKRAIEWLEKT